MTEETTNPIARVIKEYKEKECEVALSGWDDPEIKSKEFRCNPKEGTICLVKVNFSEIPEKKKIDIPKEQKPFAKQTYWFLKNVEFYRILDTKTGADDFDVSENVVWQFGKSVIQVLKPLFKRQNEKQTGFILVYRKTQRRAFAVSINDSEASECLTISKDELIKKYFSAKRIKYEF